MKLCFILLVTALLVILINATCLAAEGIKTGKQKKSTASRPSLPVILKYFLYQSFLRSFEKTFEN
jgi:phosphate starvation-inducible membrane PsiE